jgi:hypothetical protein
MASMDGSLKPSTGHPEKNPALFFRPGRFCPAETFISVSAILVGGRHGTAQIPKVRRLSPE